MAWASSAPAAMSALAAMFRQIDLDGEVRDGPVPGDSSAPEVITVGYIGPDDDASAEADLSGADLSGGQAESYTVHCAVAVECGDERELVAQRQRLFDLFGECAGRIAADGRLGGTVANANVTSWELREDLTTGGNYLRIRFGVGCRAFRTR